MGKKERLIELKKLLENNGSFDYKEHGWTRATLFRYIADLKKQFRLDDSAINVEGTKVFISDRKCFENANVYQMITPEVVNKYKIMYFLENGMNDIHDLYVFNEEDFGITCPGRTTIDQTIRLLEQEDEIDIKDLIISDKKRKICHVQNKNIPITWDLSYGQLNNIYDLLQYAKGSALAEQYDEIGESCRELLSLNGDVFYPLEVYYESYGRTLETANRLEQDLEILKKVNYRQHAIQFQESERGKKIVVEVALVFYSVETDQLYILGNPSKKNVDYICHPVSRLYDIKELENPNKIYGDVKFVEIYNQMYGVASNEKLYEVKLNMDNNPDVRGKLKCLERNRKYGKIVVNKNKSKLIYTDKIRGLSSFSRLVRSYGSACQVIQPEELKNKISKGAQSAINNYMGECKNEG